jgi:hypothetical protein
MTILAIQARKLIIGGGKVIFGIRHCSSEGREERPIRHSCGARVFRCLLNKLFWVTATERGGVWD